MTDQNLTREAVERFVMEIDCGCLACEDAGIAPIKDPWGRWVRYTDYDALAQQNAALQAEVERRQEDIFGWQARAVEFASKAQKAEAERDEARATLADAERDMRQRAAYELGHHLSDDADVTLCRIWQERILALPLKHADREGSK